MPDRNRKPRKAHVGSIPQRLSNYIVFTDTNETEGNYIEGLKSSLPSELQRSVVIKIYHAHTSDLVQKCLERASAEPQYAEPWIVLDRDQVPNFNDIIQEAYKKNIRVAWSNPCIEIWFFAYFGMMNHCSQSRKCCADFSRFYEQQFGHEYDKADRDIYRKLCNKGDEQKAIRLAKQKYESFKHDEGKQFSDMNPSSTMYLLVSQIIKYR